MKRIFFLALFCASVAANGQSVGKLFRYVNTATSGHFYTTNWDELGNGKGTFKFENVAGYVLTAAIDGAVPMHRYYNKDSKSHFYTTNWDELGKGKGSFIYENIAFYAFKTQVAGSVPLYRYYNARYNNHFFTANFAELGEGRDGFKSEGIAGYIFPDEATAIAAAKPVAAPAVVSAPPVAAPAAVPVAAPAPTAPATTDFIRLDNGTAHSNYQMFWKTALLNQVVAVLDNRNQPLMLIMLPANGGHSPVPGTYPIAEGSKRAVKKGSQVAKLEYEPGFESVEGGGTLTITENDGIYWFSAENVSIINKKTNETRKVSFKMGMFIQKA
ncbi:MAG: hypothetical protein JWP27_1774 [Flaviaesturariibacter sp.]|nr:hypothetical protein [Flaviaesturariibacter sp.]